MTLFEPLQFPNGVRANNRLALAALTNGQSHADGTLGAPEQRWLRARAEGGFGVVTTCAAYVADDGKSWRGQLGIAHEAHVPGLTELARSLREVGALPLVQLFHGGLRASAEISGMPAWSASESEGCRAATELDIERVIEQFRVAAERAWRAGFGGVELHGAHGYLLAQFLSVTENRRNDTWGGALEARARLLRGVLREVRAVVPAELVVGVRLSPEDFRQTRGIDLDESVQVARWLADDGADFVHLSLWDCARNTQKYPAQHALPLFRRALPAAVPLFAAGKIWTRADAEAVRELGADGIALGRAAILNPDWPHRACDDAWQPLRPPATPSQLAERAVSPVFVDYLRRGWPGFVSP